MAQNATKEHKDEKNAPKEKHVSEAKPPAHEKEEPKKGERPERKEAKAEKRAPEHPVKRAVHHVKHAAQPVRHVVHHVKGRVKEIHAAHKARVGARAAKRAERRAKRGPKKSLGERWDDLTEGHFGTLIYIFLGYLIAVAAIEVMKPIMATDTPVIAVFSDSMVPTFEKGDMVFVQGGTQINAGDIVVYDAPIYKYPIVHRVINVTADGVATKGDHNALVDPWTTPSYKVHGKAVLRVPYLGWVKVLAYELLGIV